MRVKFSQTYKKNNCFIWGSLFYSSFLILIHYNQQYLCHNLLKIIFKPLKTNILQTQLFILNKIIICNYMIFNEFFIHQGGQKVVFVI